MPVIILIYAHIYHPTNNIQANSENPQTERGWRVPLLSAFHYPSVQVLWTQQTVFNCHFMFEFWFCFVFFFIYVAILVLARSANANYRYFHFSLMRILISFDSTWVHLIYFIFQCVFVMKDRGILAATISKWHLIQYHNAKIHFCLHGITHL